MSKNNLEKYKVNFKVQSKDQTIEDVLGQISLPEKITDPIELELMPTKNQLFITRRLSEFSILGEIKDTTGNIETEIKAEKVYFNKQSSTYWGSEIVDTTLTASPIDLKITNYLNQKSSNFPTNPTEGFFWLTPSIMLSPTQIIESSFTGQVKVENVRNFKFDLIATLLSPSGVESKKFLGSPQEAQWRKDLYNLRNQIVHEGNRSVTFEDAKTGLVAGLHAIYSIQNLTPTFCRQMIWSGNALNLLHLTKSSGRLSRLFEN